MRGRPCQWLLLLKRSCWRQAYGDRTSHGLLVCQGLSVSVQYSKAQSVSSFEPWQTEKPWQRASVSPALCRPQKFNELPNLGGYHGVARTTTELCWVLKNLYLHGFASGIWFWIAKQIQIQEASCFKRKKKWLFFFLIATSVFHMHFMVKENAIETDNYNYQSLKFRL